MKRHKCLIAAPASGSGKTTITLGLMKALSNRGFKVQPFKCGPDYIDSWLHRMATDRPSVNLDTFMASTTHNEQIFEEAFAKCDFAFAEGVMGLFDGADRDKGSSAEIAKLLDIPIVLVMDASSVAYSVAATLYGFKNFDKKINLAGVIFNKVGSEAHYQYLVNACEDVGVEPLGYLPRNADFSIGSRHLGLKITPEGQQDVITKVADQIEESIDITSLLRLTKFDWRKPKKDKQPVKEKTLTISVALDEAFNFTYVKNVNALEQLANVLIVSPLWDKQLPPETDILYIPGGYPELFAAQLANNHAFKSSVIEYLENGGRCLAECGGMMYLGRQLKDADGTHHEMVGLFDFSVEMKEKLCAIGYRKVMTADGEYMRGHEFHYSTIENDPGEGSAFHLLNAFDKPVATKVFRKANTIASYVHTYWAEHPERFLGMFDK